MRTEAAGAHTHAWGGWGRGRGGGRGSSLTVLRLPPGLEAVVGEGGDHVLDGVADGVGVLVVHLPGVAHKAVGLLLMDRTRKPFILFYFFTFDFLFHFFHSAASRPVCAGMQVSLSAAHLFINPFSVRVRRGLAWAPDVFAVPSLTHSHTRRNLSVWQCA